MSKYENLYLISSSLFFQELEKDIAEIRGRQKTLENSIAEIREVLADTLLENKVRSKSDPTPFVKKWFYDVRFPSYSLSNMYSVEENDGAFKRWVGPERFLEFSCLIDRSAQYEFFIHLVDFMSEEVKQEFVLKVDDEEIPWLFEQNALWLSPEKTARAIIPEDFRPRVQDRTQIALGPREIVARPNPTTGDLRTLWFSLSSIKIEIR